MYRVWCNIKKHNYLTTMLRLHIICRQKQNGSRLSTNKSIVVTHYVHVMLCISSSICSCIFLQDESKRVSEEVKAHMTEELKQTVQDWERKLEETVEVTKHQCHAELLQAVAEARKEEQKAADEMRTRLTQ